MAGLFSGSAAGDQCISWMFDGRSVKASGSGHNLRLKSRSVIGRSYAHVRFVVVTRKLTHRLWPDVLPGDRGEVVAQILTDDASELVGEHCGARDDGERPQNAQHSVAGLENTRHASNGSCRGEFSQVVRDAWALLIRRHVSSHYVDETFVLVLLHLKLAMY